MTRIPATQCPAGPNRRVRQNSVAPRRQVQSWACSVGPDLSSRGGPARAPRKTVPCTGPRMYRMQGSTIRLRSAPQMQPGAKLLQRCTRECCSCTCKVYSKVLSRACTHATVHSGGPQQACPLIDEKQPDVAFHSVLRRAVTYELIAAPPVVAGYMGLHFAPPPALIV